MFGAWWVKEMGVMCISRGWWDLGTEGLEPISPGAELFNATNLPSWFGWRQGGENKELNWGSIHLTLQDWSTASTEAKFKHVQNSRPYQCQIVRACSDSRPYQCQIVRACSGCPQFIVENHLFYWQICFCFILVTV